MRRTSASAERGWGLAAAVAGGVDGLSGGGGEVKGGDGADAED